MQGIALAAERFTEEALKQQAEKTRTATPPPAQHHSLVGLENFAADSPVTHNACAFNSVLQLIANNMLVRPLHEAGIANAMNPLLRDKLDNLMQVMSESAKASTQDILAAQTGLLAVWRNLEATKFICTKQHDASEVMQALLENIETTNTPVAGMTSDEITIAAGNYHGWALKGRAAPPAPQQMTPNTKQ